MKTTIACLVALLAVVTFAAGSAFADEPATAPSTAPAKEGAEKQNPKEALKAYNAAMHAGDVERMVALQHATNDEERRVARAVATADMYVAKLLQAARDKFGGQEAMARVGRAIHDASDADIDAAELRVEGDQAAIMFAGGGAAPMIRVDGQWKSNVGALVRSFEGNAQAAIDEFSRRGNFAKVLAQDVAAGKYETLDELIARIEKHEAGRDEEEMPN